MTEVEVAWVAGILEGEGCFDAMHSTTRDTWYPRVRLHMCDKDVVEKFKRVTGMGGGEVNIVKSDNPNHSDVYTFQIGAKEEVRELLTEILPHLGQRRSEKVRELLSYIE